MSILLDVTGKLPSGLVEMYRAVSDSSEGLPFLIVGAMARDLVLHHGFGAPIERGTRDVDFAIRVDSWEDFHELKVRLLGNGFMEDSRLNYRFRFTDSEEFEWEMDILPFGEIEDESGDIAWPPDNEVAMSMLGFADALEYSWEVTLSEGCVVKVATPISMIVLKLVAWTERDRSLRAKDASDVGYIIKNYNKISEIENRLYEEGFMERNEWDMDLATSELVGYEIPDQINDATYDYLKEQFSDANVSENFIRDMNVGNSEEMFINLFKMIV